MAENNKTGWAGLGTRQRAGLAIGAFAIVAAAAAAGYFVFRPDYQVLFSDLAPQDAAAMVAELDRLKVPYRIEGADTILVPQDQVPKTRMKLMAKELPLHGAVGFELFNNSDFGMTEFAQKVNYQRALQGELTRTIMAVDDVLSARVHIAIPDQGLFRKTTAKPKASITVAMKPGRTLRPEQVAGIQRLVSSAIPDIAAQDVTIVNQHGVALTRPDSGDGSTADASGSRLDSKRAVEEYLARKVADVLDRALGPAQAMATVDVVLNLDQTRVTTDDVLPSSVSASANPTGVIVRQRQVMHDSSSSPVAGDLARREPGAGNLDVEYQVGHRTEQVISAPGAIQKLGVAVVLKAAADSAQLERIKNLVAVAVGFNSDRGDGIAVYSMDQLPASRAAETGIGAGHPAAADAPEPAPLAAKKRAEASSALPDAIARMASLLPWALLAAIGVLALGILLERARRRASRAKAAKPLQASEREATLARVREWLDADRLAATTEGKR